MSLAPSIVLVKGAGDIGTGVAHRLHRCGFRVVCTEAAQPTVIRRAVAFASAVYAQSVLVDGITAELLPLGDRLIERMRALHERNIVAVIVDPSARSAGLLNPIAMVDAVLAKRNTGTQRADARVVIACGPGFTAGIDCHAVVETQRGHDLGRVLYTGGAQPNTGVPGEVGGTSAKRVMRAPCDGLFMGVREIGDWVTEGDVIARVESNDHRSTEVHATLTGMLRGILHTGLQVRAGMKIADIDPRTGQRYCFSISDKALAIGGGVVEALMHLLKPTIGVRPIQARTHS